MSLDDLLRFLFILIFFIVPILRAVARRNQAPPPKPTPKRPVAGPPAQGGGPVVNVPTSTVTTTTLSGDFEKRLAEARRKVQEAMQQGGFTQPEKPQNLGQESASGLFQTTPKQPASLSIPKPTTSLPQAQSITKENSEIFHKTLTIAPPLQKITSRGTKHAKLGKHVLFGPDMLNEQGLTRGLIWQQILSEPKSKQKRRSLSQHQ